MPVIVRMEAAHVAEVCGIERVSFRPPWSEASFMEEIGPLDAESCVALGGEGGVRVEGYVCARRIGDEGEVLRLAVRPESRGRGLGRALIEKALERLRAMGCSCVHVEVRESNAAGRALYAGAGFTPVGRRERYYIDPEEDAILMRKTF